jgi:hypothetical protein
VVLRRWYLFWVVAFFPAALMAHGLEIYQQHGLAWRRYVAIGRNATIVGLVFVVSMAAFAAPLAWKIVRTDYADIYSAYRTSNSLLEVAGLIPGYFGWAVIITSVSGLIWLAVRRETRVAGLLLITQSIIIFVMFARTQDFGVHHYLLLFPAVALGVAAVVIGLLAKITDTFWRTASVGLVIAVLLASSGAVFAPQAAVLSALGSFVPKERTYPLIRNDIDAVDRLLDRLGDLEQRQPGDIYVVASSYHILNSEIVTNGCTIGPPQRNFCDRILDTNNVDKRDGFPRQFLHASYVVVADPPQYHLRPADQRVIGVLARELTAGHGIGTSFQRLPEEFRLDDGVTVSLYAKVRPFEKADLAALTAEFAGYYPDRKSMFTITDD